MHVLAELSRHCEESTISEKDERKSYAELYPSDEGHKDAIEALGDDSVV